MTQDTAKSTCASDSRATAGQKATAIPIRTYNTSPTFLHNYHAIYSVTSVSQCCLIVYNVFRQLPQ